jgi:curved DNA-binding protein CbpA
MEWKNVTNNYNDPIIELRTKSPYEILNVSEDADIPTIKKAFYKAAKKYHPDKSEDFFKNINNEYMKIYNDAYKKLLEIKK